MNGTSWLLGAGYPWHSGDPAAERPEPRGSKMVANRIEGLSLATLATGPLGLESADGSLGRLTLPHGVAVDGTTVLMLTRDGSRVLCYDAVEQSFTTLPEVGVEGLGSERPEHVFAEPRRFQRAANIAALDGLLYVADPEAHRVQVFDLATLALIRLHEGLSLPSDVAAGRRGVYVLDRGAARVHRATSQADDLSLIVDMPSMKGRWDRIAIDRDERVYVHDTGSQPPALVMLAPPPRGASSSEAVRFGSSAEVRDRFGLSDVFIDGRGELMLPERLLDPCVLRHPREPHQLAWTIDGRVYVIDTRARTVTVHLADGRVRHRFGPYGATGMQVPADAPTSWAPVDLVEVDGCVFVLDERHQTVHVHRPGSELLHRRFSAPADHGTRWRRIAHDGNGCLLLWDGIGARVDRVDQRGENLQQVPAKQARGSFTARGVEPPPPPKGPPRPSLTPAFERAGVWTSRWLDSDIYNCQWHAIEMTVSLPPGSHAKVRTRTSNERESDAEVAANVVSIGALGSWRDTHVLTGASQPDDSELKPRRVSMLVPSGPGQYIQLQIELSGDSIQTPVIHGLRLRFPRESLLQYLPAVYSQPEDQREFLDRFLSIVQATWSDIEREVETFERYLDPDSVPPEAMAYLAGWLDLRLEGTWSAEQNRKLLQAMPRLRDQWGTTDGLIAWLRVYLANLGRVGIEDLERAGIPGIVESFVERRRLILNRTDAATLGVAEGLWSASVERRFQLGVFEQAGEVELVSDPHPETDLFRHYAHSFRVFVPATWVRTADDEALIRRAIELQKPAHTTYELVLVEPRFRIGEQSTLDLDTVIGAPLPASLQCATLDTAPERPPSHRLGYDTTLGGTRDNGGLR